jgi:ferritin-like metal-binding protein YciE
MAQKTSLEDLLEDEIKDLYSAEKQLIKAIPQMAKASHHEDLKQAFQDHLEETKTQLERLSKIAEMMDFKPTGKKCKGMEGVIEEGSEAISEKGDPAILDIGIVGAASRVEHYEIAGYMTAIALCQQLGQSEACSLLEESLAEEQAADEKLRELCTELMESVDGDADSDGEDDDEESENSESESNEKMPAKVGAR